MYFTHIQQLRYLSKGVENFCPYKTCTRMFIVALFTIDKIWKQGRCPSGDEWINKSVAHPDNGMLAGLKEMSCQSMRRHRETWMHITKWKRPTWKATYCMIPTTWYFEKVELWRQYKDQCYQGFWVREEEAEHRGFLLCEITVWDFNGGFTSL
jgi:hypothetical protein